MSEDKVAYAAPKRLDAVSTPGFDRDITAFLNQGASQLAIDMEATVYISSVALRVLLKTVKAMKARDGSLVLTHVCDQVKEVFDVTGFSSFLVIEE